MARPIKIVITAEQLAALMDSNKFDNHRQLVEWLFNGRGWYVINFTELRYNYKNKKFMTVEGVPGVAILSK